MSSVREGDPTDEERLQVQGLQEDRLEGGRMQDEGIHEDRLPEDSIQNESVQGERIEDDRLQDERLPDEGLSDERMPDERMPDERMQDERIQSYPSPQMPEERIQGSDRMQSYPSPSTEAQDTGPYYHAGPRDDTQQDQPQPPPTPQQQPSHSASVEELQLAAQLGQDLAAEPMMHVTDPGMNVEDPNLRSIMPHPHPEQPQPQPQPQHQAPPPPPPPPRPYVPEEALPESLQQHVPVSVAMDHHHLAQSYALGDNTPPRKRSKVSRACDECRRKKVKCDAQSDSGDNPCSNCKRSGIRCMFSRVPQKRGPSKGYIKELADRINSIEGKLEIQSESLPPDSMVHWTSAAASLNSTSGPGEDASRKRPFSSISSADLSTPAPQRHATWGTEHRPLQPMATPSDRFQSSPFTTNGLAPQPMPIKNDMQPRPPVAPMDGSVTDMPDIDQARDVDDEVFNGYLTMIQPYLPFLPSSKALIQDYLAQCPGLLREAFVEALSGTIHSFPSFQSGSPGDVRLAHTLLVEWEASDSTSRTPVANLVFLQTLLLMIIEADNRPLGSIGAPKESLLGRAVASANTLKLYQAKADLSEAEAGSDTESELRVRIWWSLVMLDRWNAVGAAVPSLIRDESVIVSASLRMVVGEVQYLLIRASKFLSRASVMITNFQEPLNSTFADRMVGSFMDAWVEDFREDLPAHIEAGLYPVVHLVYWHCRLLAYLLNPSARSTDALWPAQELINLLVSHSQLITPLHHHFTVLAVITLIELAKVDKTKEDATRLLGEFRDSSLPASVFDGLVRDKIADHLRPSTSAAAASAPSAMEAAASQGLQHLADLATLSSAAADKAEGAHTYRTAPNYEDMGFDPRPLLLVGYLNVVRATQQAA
ncbi:C6 finger domain-containing protein [Colletotrichum incanum]|nr:C6 finger domain-containing protein [Colletotrichum incanum]